LGGRVRGTKIGKVPNMEHWRATESDQTLALDRTKEIKTGVKKGRREGEPCIETERGGTRWFRGLKKEDYLRKWGGGTGMKSK